jgi:hypothetical protein
MCFFVNKSKTNKPLVFIDVLQVSPPSWQRGNSFCMFFVVVDNFYGPAFRNSFVLVILKRTKEKLNVNLFKSNIYETKSEI